MFIHFVYDVEYGFLQETYKNNWDKIRVVFPALVHFQILKTQASHISTFLCILRIFLAESTASEQHFARSFLTGLSKSQQQNWHIANERTNEQRKKQTKKQANIQTYMNSYIHAYIHTYIHTFIHSYIHTYIPSQPNPYHTSPCHAMPYPVPATVCTFIHWRIFFSSLVSSSPSFTANRIAAERIWANDKDCKGDQVQPDIVWCTFCIDGLSKEITLLNQVMYDV